MSDEARGAQAARVRAVAEQLGYWVKDDGDRRKTRARIARKMRLHLAIVKSALDHTRNVGRPSTHAATRARVLMLEKHARDVVDIWMAEAASPAFRKAIRELAGLLA